MKNSKNSVDSSGAGFDFLPAARFDEVASANAQPVQPIPTSRVSFWIQRAHDAREMLTARTKAVALVLIGGLAIGTLGGTMLVKQTSSPDATPTVQASTAETKAPPQASGDIASKDEPSAVEASAIALKSAGQTSSRVRRHRKRPPIQHGQQAYRVDVIRQ
jgi:hypothetical protein